MKRVVLILLFISSILSAKVVNIAVAANVSYAIEDLKKEFKKLYPDIDVRVTLGSSGKLTAQIFNKAPYDIFLSANMKYPEALHVKGFSVKEPVVYAKGALALLSFKARDFTKGLSLLNDKDIRRIAVANPKTAPYGKAALEVLKNSGFLKKTLPKLIYAESVSGVVLYILKAADLGFVAKSSLYCKKLQKFKEGVNWTEVDSSLYTPIKQGMVLLKNSKEAKAFYEFILGKKAKVIFEKYGYKF